MMSSGTVHLSYVEAIRCSASLTLHTSFHSSRFSVEERYMHQYSSIACDIGHEFEQAGAYSNDCEESGGVISELLLIADIYKMSIHFLLLIGLSFAWTKGHVLTG